MAKSATKEKSEDVSTSTRSNGQEENVSGYFRPILKERPELLDKRSNEYLLKRWLKDHPDVESVPERVRNILANLKSGMRKKRRKRRKKRAEASPAPVPSRSPTRSLASLEENIDECLTLARNLDRAGLESVIKILRKARNEVVWKIGQ